MRFVVWLIVLFAVAVVAATVLGSNDGLVSIYWRGWRTDLSLNFFLLAAVAGAVLLYTSVRAIGGLVGLPTRAREWRELRRERSANESLREAFAEYHAGRFRRAHKAALQALSLQAATQAISGDAGMRMLARLVGAASLHRLQDRAARDAMLAEALANAAPSEDGRPVDDGLRLLAAEWALDDNDADRAAEMLAQLPPGVARRTQALRLKLRVLRAQRRPLDALQTARLLANHQGFSRQAAQSILRSLAMEALDEASDAEQLRRVWQQFDAGDRRDPFVAAHTAIAMTRFWANDEARRLLVPFWDQVTTFGTDEREALSLALLAAIDDIETDWLPRLEAAARSVPNDPAIAAAVGVAMAERQLWGKARFLLEQVGSAAGLHARLRRQALRRLAQIAREEGDEARAARVEHDAAQLD